ncbi:hypothetical protein [Proteus mirabilis]|uniref:hypothetical protein n=1 Tax=Proteus mirabilis TaxID=584 RepID=UPI001CC1F185|nr:hypothetical protein [Proteus mirabilis]
MRIECYSWSDVSEQILEQAIALQNSAFEDMKGNFYQVDIPYKLVLAIDDNQVIGHVAVYLRDVYQKQKNIGSNQHNQSAKNRDFSAYPYLPIMVRIMYIMLNGT